MAVRDWIADWGRDGLFVCWSRRHWRFGSHEPDNTVTSANRWDRLSLRARVVTSRRRDSRGYGKRKHRSALETAGRRSGWGAGWILFGGPYAFQETPVCAVRGVG